MHPEYIYIYISRERERERERSVFMFFIVRKVYQGIVFMLVIVFSFW